VATQTSSTGSIASDLRDVLGQLFRRLRSQGTFPLMQGSVLARLDRCGPQSVSDLAGAEGVRPQSMAQTVSDLEAAGLVVRRPDPQDGRRALVELTDSGLERLHSERRHRQGWLAEAIEDSLSAKEQAVLTQATELMRRLAERPR
jgi:DNA-binding MarR family transcriptional regulator